MAEAAMIQRIQAVCQSLAYGLYDSGKSFPIIGEPNYPTMMEKNLIVETIAAMNRQTPLRQQFIPNHLVKTAVGYTLHWLKHCRSLQKAITEGRNPDEITSPEWGEEYR